VIRGFEDGDRGRFGRVFILQRVTSSRQTRQKSRIVTAARRRSDNVDFFFEKDFKDENDGEFGGTRWIHDIPRHGSIVALRPNQKARRLGGRGSRHRSMIGSSSRSLFGHGFHAFQRFIESLHNGQGRFDALVGRIGVRRHELTGQMKERLVALLVFVHFIRG
jgi:hypothetical protein